MLLSLGLLDGRSVLLAFAFQSLNLFGRNLLASQRIEDVGKQTQEPKLKADSVDCGSMREVVNLGKVDPRNSVCCKVNSQRNVSDKRGQSQNGVLSLVGVDGRGNLQETDRLASSKQLSRKANRILKSLPEQNSFLGRTLSVENVRKEARPVLNDSKQFITTD